MIGTIPIHRPFIGHLVRSLFTPLHYAARYGHSFIVDRICVLHNFSEAVLHDFLAAEDCLSWINALDQYACAFSFPLAHNPTQQM